MDDSTCASRRLGRSFSANNRPEIFRQKLSDAMSTPSLYRGLVQQKRISTQGGFAARDGAAPSRIYSPASSLVTIATAFSVVRPLLPSSNCRNGGRKPDRTHAILHTCATERFRHGLRPAQTTRRRLPCPAGLLLEPTSGTRHQDRRLRALGPGVGLDSVAEFPGERHVTHCPCPRVRSARRLPVVAGCCRSLPVAPSSRGSMGSDSAGQKLRRSRAVRTERINFSAWAAS